jgi:octaprenyl-diphosphate synthase
MCKKNYNHKNDHLDLAAAVEFIHAATLMHDDVVDESKKRRGQLTSNEVWGNKTSVLVGDFLFSRAFQLMAKTGSAEILKILSDTSVTIAEGEVLELSNDKDPTINEDIYFEVINGKTASLFGAACQVGAIATKASNEKVEALKTFGLNFGMSFQLIDDAIDYSSSFFHLGKNIGDDFKQGKVTLPVILAYLRSNNEEKKYWKRTMQDLYQQKDDFEKALTIINKYNCIDDTIKRAEHFANIAIDSLGIFDDTVFKEVLINLTDSGLKRFY